MEENTKNKVLGILEYNVKENNTFRKYEREIRRIMSKEYYFVEDVLSSLDLSLEEYYNQNKGGLENDK